MKEYEKLLSLVIREINRLGLTEAAKQAQTSAQYLSMVKNGRRKLKIETLERFAKNLKVI